MRAVLCKKLGTPPTLAIEEIEPPPLAPGAVRIEVRACGVNFADTLIVQGKYQVKPTLPFIPGMEVGGVVTECGAEVSEFAPGDRVLAMSSNGGLTEQVVVETKRVLAIPEAMDFAAAASFPVAYGTSHLGLAHRARLKAGEVLLVHGASGGVGLSAVEIGKAMGAVVIATASTPEKLEIAKAHGADHLVDYSRESIRERVKALTGGADVVYDPVGGEAFMESLRCINWEGRLLVIGFASGTIPQIPANYLLLKNCAAIGLFWGAYMTHNPKLVRDSLIELLRWFEAGKLKPHISRQLPLDDAGEALALLQDRKSVGKIVVTTGRE